MNLDRQDESQYEAQHYKAHLFEQYKMYVEMTDRISARRNGANTFFLTIHTTFLAALGVLSKTSTLSFKWVVIPLVAALLLCTIWFKMIKSYKQLNSARFKVINDLEQRLPVAPYEEEWTLLNNSTGREKYKSLTSVEKWVPVVFALLYVVFGILQFFDNGKTLFA